MDAKLTLSIEKEIVSKAKQYAREKGVSLSEMVENYFVLLTKPSNPDDIELSTTVKSLKGSFTAPDDFDYKTVLHEEKSRKFL